MLSIAALVTMKGLGALFIPRASLRLEGLQRSARLAQRASDREVICDNSLRAYACFLIASKQLVHTLRCVLRLCFDQFSLDEWRQILLARGSGGGCLGLEMISQSRCQSHDC
jgi:hypothetical protein